METQLKQQAQFPGAADAPDAHPTAQRFTYTTGARPLDGYTIKRGIGQGGFGEIYYAVSDAGKEVALKLVRRNLQVELRGIRQCLNVKHPNLVDLYDIRQDAHGDTWVIMEYVPGLSLEDALAANPNGLPMQQALAWFHGIAAGVSYLHDRGIVHRDLKPANIFSCEGLVKVGDYGLSKFISCSRRSGHTESIGTVHYMAPEVANGRYGKAIDIYALGVILYEMLTGRVPFEGESVGEVLMKHLTARPDLSQLAEPFRSVVGRALEKDPNRRFASVAEMAAALPRPASAGATAGWGVAVGAPASGSASPGVAEGTEAVVRADAADDEPILCAVRENCGKLRRAWKQSNLPLPIKILLIVALVFLLAQHGPLVIGLAIVACISYGGYRLIREIVLAIKDPQRTVQPVAHPAMPPAAARAEPAARQPPVVRAAMAQPVPAAASAMRNGRYGDEHAAPYVVKSFRQRLTELLGSLLFGSLVATVAAGMMLLISSYGGVVPKIEHAAWLVLAAIAGTWAVLVPAKFWEHRQGDPALRRFTMMVVGAGIGLFAWFIADVLLVSLPRADLGDLHKYQLPAFYGPDGTAMPLAYVASFATVFLLLRWWKQTDPLRHTRLSLWSVICTVLVGAAVGALWHFPQLWVPMVVGSVSIAVQMASPWVEFDKRHKRMLRHG